MFEMLSKLAEILVMAGKGLLNHRRTTRDVDVAGALLPCATALQNLCVRGGRLLSLAEKLVDGAERPTAEKFVELVEEQADEINNLRSALVDVQPLLATIDVSIYVDLVPFLDEKSGLINRWRGQAADGPSSTTMLFFLPAETLDHVLAVGKEHASPNGLSIERLEYLVAVSDGIRLARSHEVRDLSSAVPARHLHHVRQEISTARAALDRTKVLCEQLLASMEEAVGREAIARLRRKLAPKPGQGQNS